MAGALARLAEILEKLNGVMAKINPSRGLISVEFSTP
jgi:hypothetical protein